MEKFTTELLALLLGSNSFAAYVAGLIFAGMGAYARLYIRSLKRDPQSRATPRNFSVRFLILDNLRGFLAGVIICLLTFRFSLNIQDVNQAMLYAAGLGFGGTSLDSIAGFFEGKAREKFIGG